MELCKGDISLKFDNEKGWEPFYGKIIGSNLYIYNAIVENDFQVMFNLYLCELHIRKDDIFYIEIYHYFDRNKLLLTINPKLQQMAKMAKCKSMITIKNQLK